MHPDRDPRGQLKLYLTGEHDCSYLDGQRARTLFVDPLARIDGNRAEWLQRMGFRRSGDHFYRPACRFCQRCTPVRVPVAAFRPNRAQRRNLARNGDVRISVMPAMLRPEHYPLYARYITTRHADGDMADDVSLASYARFLLAPWGGETWFVEGWLGERLLFVAVTDVFANALSAVYTFFDPDFAERGPGTCAVLKQLELAAGRGLEHVYLGYWIPGSRKMAYKDNYRPIEAWDGQHWRPFGRGEPIAWEVPMA